MANELRSSAHSVGEANLHLQFTPAYRARVFADTLVRELVIGYIVQKANAMGVCVAAIECGPDHVHLFVTNWRKHSPKELARKLKGYTSYMLRRGHVALFKHLLWGEKFWSAGYFYRTCGVVTAETVKQYINEGQRKHWVENPSRKQRTLLSFST